jgi:hypothetical protein
MKKVFLVLAVMAIIAGLVCVNMALAHRFGKRQVHHQERIDQGIKIGALTCGEARLLEQEERHIQRQKRRAWSDGELTPRECLRLERKQDCARRDIYRMKHNHTKMWGNVDRCLWNR